MNLYDRRTLCPGGTDDISPAIYCWEGSACRMSAVGTAEDPSDFNGWSLQPSPGTELPDSRNPSNKLLGYCRFVPPGQREQASRAS